MITIDKFNERLLAERVSLENFVRQQMDLLDAMAKVQVYFAGRNGSTPKEAGKLLLAISTGEFAARTHGGKYPGDIQDWSEKIAGTLKDGPRHAFEIWDALKAEGIPESKHKGFYQALASAAQKRKGIERVGKARGLYRLIGVKDDSGQTKIPPIAVGRPGHPGKWEERITAALKDSKSRTGLQLMDDLKIGKKDRVMRQRFSAAIPALRRKGILQTDDQGLHRLTVEDQRRPAPEVWRKRVSRRRDRSSEFQWTAAVRAILADGKQRTLSEIWTDLKAAHKDPGMTRQRFNVAVPRMVRVGHLVRDNQGRHSLAKRKV